MTATLLWLLINFSEPVHPSVIEQFVSGKECLRVAKILYDDAYNRGIDSPRLRCVQAAVAR